MFKDIRFYIIFLGFIFCVWAVAQSFMDYDLVFAFIDMVGCVLLFIAGAYCIFTFGNGNNEVISALVVVGGLLMLTPALGGLFDGQEDRSKVVSVLHNSVVCKNEIGFDERVHALAICEIEGYSAIQDLTASSYRLPIKLRPSVEFALSVRPYESSSKKSACSGLYNDFILRCPELEEYN